MSIVNSVIDSVFLSFSSNSYQFNTPQYDHTLSPVFTIAVSFIDDSSYNNNNLKILSSTILFYSLLLLLLFIILQ